MFITESLAAFLRAPEKTDGRDYVAMSMLSALKAAHPEKYDAVKLDGLEKEAFSKAVADLSTKMKTRRLFRSVGG